jgi:replicative DNA helicase
MVIHALDAFERHDSRGGGRELGPEHRNGPSKTITVAHQLHLLRFANLAKSIRLDRL